jgi:hypothetical protein
VTAFRALLNRWRRRLARALLYRVVFGERSGGRLLPHTRISPAACIEHEERLVLGDHVYIGPFNFLEASGGITLGDGVQLTSHISIVTHASHRSQRLLGEGFVNWPGERPGWIAGPVVVGPYSFIGPHALIGPTPRWAAAPWCAPAASCGVTTRISPSWKAARPASWATPAMPTSACCSATPNCARCTKPGPRPRPHDPAGADR